MRKTPLQKKIPEAMRNTLAKDPFMKHCIAGDITCSGRIEWHHAFNYAGKRVNELWAILPLCHAHHDRADSAYIKNYCELAMKDRAEQWELTDVARKKYPLSKLFR